jgi:hypothetical protein
MNRIQTSFKSFALPKASARQKPMRQNIAIRQNILIRGNTRKCLECKGLDKILFGKGGKVIKGFYPLNILYPHKVNCSQKNLW